MRSGSQGIEPSQYLKEKKVKTIPIVAASELEEPKPGQVLKPGGVAGLVSRVRTSWPAGVTGGDWDFLAEAGWKAVPKNVKAMYAKGSRRFCS